MVFSSILFLFYFLLITVLLYRLAPKKLKNFVLFVCSLVFYAWGEPVYVFLMLFSITLNYVSGLIISGINKNKKKRKKVLLISCGINILLLAFFKYTPFLVECFNSISPLKIPVLHLALPVGISFYTFQAMSYIIDVYRKDVPAQKNFIDFGTYVALFPQLIAGPIVRYRTIANQLKKRTESIDKFIEGFNRFVVGLAKKVLIANNVGMLWDSIHALNTSSMSVATAWLGCAAFTLQIYFDFSGYSDMAIGLGKMFGFNFNENFNYPYISKSVTEFWRRWHISLSTWFKEYVYIPLGGNRAGIKRMYFNIMVVWLLTGIWHGAGFNFLFWGIYYGVILIIEKKFILKRIEKIPAFIQHIYAIVLVMFGWVLFSADNLGGALKYMTVMLGFGAKGFSDATFSYYLGGYIFILIVGLIASLPKPREVFVRFARGNRYILVPVCTMILLIICTAYLVDATYNPFLYFRF